MTTHQAPAVRHAALWASLFVYAQIACQLALLVEFLGSKRVLVRAAAFVLSIAFVVLVPGRERPHPSRAWLLAALAVVGLSILHPQTNSLPAGFAHFMLYIAVAAPLFWACRLQLTERVFRNIIMSLWLFHTASAAVGVLQMHYPGRFQPHVSTTIEALGDMADAYKIQLANGQYVWRPMGLSDTPGGATAAGLYAVVFGLGVFIYARAPFIRAISIGGIGVGLFCLYIGQVRSLLVMAGICSATLLGILIWRGDAKRVLAIALIAPLLIVAAFVWATHVGGEATVNRLQSLVQERPEDVYNQSRGHFLTYTFTELLPQYPIGAGLVRWGMMRNYFGDENNTNSPMIWVEIQLTGWLLDGGLPLMILYSGAVLIACGVSLHIAWSWRPGGIPTWGALLFALNVAYVAVTFNYPVFIGQSGMEFWFLNGCLFAMAQRPERRRRLPGAARHAATDFRIARLANQTQATA